MLRIRKITVRALAALGFCYLLVTLTAVTGWWARRLAGPWQDPEGDVLIVLGADAPNSNIIGESSYWRSVYAVLAWRNGHFRNLVIAGGDGIATSMRNFLVCHGIPAPAIVVESRSTSTRENALFTAEIIRSLPGRKILLTSDYHMHRAWRVFRKAGIETVPRPFPDAIKRSNNIWLRWPLFVQLCGETTKIVYYRMRGWI